MTDHCNWENWIASEGNEKQDPNTKTCHIYLFLGYLGNIWGLCVWVSYESKVNFNFNVIYDPLIRGGKKKKKRLEGVE